MAEIPHIKIEKINISTVKVLLQKPNVYVNTIFPIRNVPNRSTSLLSVAVMKEDYELINYLVSKNADINLHTPKCEAPVILAVKIGNIKIIRKLLELRADVNVYNQKGEMSLHIAVQKNRHDIVKCLVANGANINAPIFGSSIYSSLRPLHLAVVSRSEDMVKLLLDENADINAKTSIGETALVKAGLNDDIAMTKFLIARGAHCISVCPNQTIIHDLLCYLKHTSVLEYLLSLDESFTDISIRTNSGESFLMFSLEYDDVDAVNSTGQLAIDFEKNRNVGISVIEEHIVKLISAGFDVSPRNRLTVAEGFESFHINCCEEVKKMKMSKVGTSQVSFFNVLLMNVHDLSVRLKYVSLNGMVDKEKILSEYLYYGGMLFYKLSKVNRRIKYLGQIERSVENMLCSAPLLLPYNFVRDLWSYFRNYELKKLSS
ncbi:Similar to RF_0381: Putative ankyrin repeat protein RF_0381 (Rickettsia felis (strain ATCC VR-1525 / URRWXCal2)) [Cotesia congregata]|uniref:Similar to RF_0381: Putative ankyrin repeat protein RF_0381 (Rickettsia felis (Strain ATCC VR-1525 / URRWXCal2)) n=1 Tax=Cotesia congregata TaxID=51543 RepID=A0A8J2H660_COTCN|nr:Similar to RF_0381: Putative ankyrin repeat protein RF_0381 (Rickettsia felis (strain ATCC VR-1525 / URRWXCal2)) [Cotesia congregata]